MKRIDFDRLFVGRRGAALGVSQEGHHRRAADARRSRFRRTGGSRARIDQHRIRSASRHQGHARAGAAMRVAAKRSVDSISISTSPISSPNLPRSSPRNARNLTAHPNLKMKLEGNTDERGTREYNIGLGERRAQAVRRALMLQGVAESQLTTVSFGAERPAVEGDDEAAWAQNRRVEMVYVP